MLVRWAGQFHSDQGVKVAIQERNLLTIHLITITKVLPKVSRFHRLPHPLGPFNSGNFRHLLIYQQTPQSNFKLQRNTHRQDAFRRLHTCLQPLLPRFGCMFLRLANKRQQRTCTHPLSRCGLLQLPSDGLLHSGHLHRMHVRVLVVAVFQENGRY